VATNRAEARFGGEEYTILFTLTRVSFSYAYYLEGIRSARFAQLQSVGLVYTDFLWPCFHDPEFEGYLSATNLYFPLSLCVYNARAREHLRRKSVGQQAHAQSHDDHGHGHDEDHAIVKSENGSADAVSAIAIMAIIILTALFWLTGHAS